MATLREISCETCGVSFQPTRSWSKYCSPRCKNTSPTKYANTKAYRQKRREMINQIKLDSGCVRCGYNEHPAALHFDHLDHTQKAFNVSQDPKRSWESIEAEIAKCDVLCANCHSVRTHEEQYIYYSARMGKT